MKSKFLSLGMGAILSGGLLSSAFAQSADDSDAARKLSHVIYSAAQRYLDDGDSWGNFENYPEYSFDCREIGKGYGASLATSRRRPTVFNSPLSRTAPFSATAQRRSGRRSSRPPRGSPPRN
jgi:hypothetical protein